MDPEGKKNLYYNYINYFINIYQEIPPKIHFIRCFIRFKIKSQVKVKNQVLRLRLPKTTKM